MLLVLFLITGCAAQKEETGSGTTVSAAQGNTADVSQNTTIAAKTDVSNISTAVYYAETRSINDNAPFPVTKILANLGDTYLVTAARFNNGIEYNTLGFADKDFKQFTNFFDQASVSSASKYLCAAVNAQGQICVLLSGGTLEIYNYKNGAAALAETVDLGARCLSGFDMVDHLYVTANRYVLTMQNGWRILDTEGNIISDEMERNCAAASAFDGDNLYVTALKNDAVNFSVSYTLISKIDCNSGGSIWTIQVPFESHFVEGIAADTTTGDLLVYSDDTVTRYNADGVSVGIELNLFTYEMRKTAMLSDIPPTVGNMFFDNGDLFFIMRQQANGSDPTYSLWKFERFTGDDALAKQAANGKSKTLRQRS